jgi:hypothetical protein
MTGKMDVVSASMLPAQPNRQVNRVPRSSTYFNGRTVNRKEVSTE